MYNVFPSHLLLKKSEKQDSFRQILKSLANMNNESSGTQFLQTIIGIQSRSDALDKSRFVMTFLTNLGD